MKNKSIIAIITCLIMIFCLSQILYARVSSTDPVTTSGGEVTITLKSSEKIYACKVKLADAGGLTFVSATSSEGQANGQEINGANASGFNTIGTYTFKVPEVTKDTKYTVKFNVSVSTDGEKFEDVVNSSTVTVKAKESAPAETEPAKKSNNANLSTLGVTPKEYDFSGFKKDKTEYTLPEAIPSTVNKLNVLYKTEDSKAKAEVSGNTNLKAGTNTIVIKVTAEDGTTKEYTIKLTKLAEDEEKPGNVLDDADEIYLTKLEIDGIELSPDFDAQTLSYKAILNEDKDEVKINAIANNPNAKVTISGNKDLKDGENTITIIVTLDGKVEQKVYQIILTKDTEIETLASENNESNSANNDSSGIERYILVGAAIIVFIILVISILIVLIRREKRKLQEYADEYDDDYDDEDEIEEVPPLKSRLYNQDAETDDYKKTIDEINAQTQSIFYKESKNKKQIEEYDEDNDDDDDDYIKERKRRRRGKH